MTMSELLRAAVLRGASDLHCMAGSPAAIRVNGLLTDLDGEELTPADTFALFGEVADEERKNQLNIKGDVDLSFSVEGLGRFRINAYKQKGAITIAARMISERIPTMEDLKLPAALAELCRQPRGLVLVTGPTGAGKSTTMAAMVDLINRERRCNIITLEDPVEFIHQNKKSLINQREIGTDAESFTSGLRAALREDPDVILVGEMRDLDTVSIAVRAAETGHLVLATLHTTDTSQTIDRIIDVFPPNQQQQIRVQLSMALKGIISQQLLPRKDGTGRVAAFEILLASAAVRNLIREGKTHQLYSVMQTGAGKGMQTMDSALLELYRSELISNDEALAHASDPENLFGFKKSSW